MSFRERVKNNSFIISLGLLLKKVFAILSVPILRLRHNLRENLPLWISGALIFLFVVAYLWPRIFITIHSGEAGVYYSRFLGGTVIDKVYREGFHIIPPWNKMYVYNVKVQTYQHTMPVLTKSGLEIMVSLNIRYKPDDRILGILHQRVGIDYLSKVIIPEIEAAIREIVSIIEPSESFDEKNRLLISRLINHAVEQISQSYVIVDDVMITRIEYPKKIKEAIEAKLEQQQLAEAYVYRLEKEKKEAERKRIEAEGTKRYNEIIAASLSENILRWKGVEATLDLSKSPNSKVIIIGAGKTGMPLILDANK